MPRFPHGKNGGGFRGRRPDEPAPGPCFLWRKSSRNVASAGHQRVAVLAFEFEMGLFPAVMEEAKQKGIDLAPNRVSAGSVRLAHGGERPGALFHDVGLHRGGTAFSTRITR